MRNWLKQIREEKGMTQDEVAKQTNISRPYYTRIELGNYNVPVDTAKKIAGVLGFDYTKFYDSDNKTA